MKSVDQPLHVMAAVLEDQQGRVLISQRPAGKSMAGRWEFPGGKLEKNEPPLAGLARELEEELDIQITQSRPLIRLVHHYPELSVLLDVHAVNAWQGEVRPQEGQAIRWVTKQELMAADLLEADRPIVNAIRLPDTLLITPDPNPDDLPGFVQLLQTSLNAGVGMVQLRATNLGRNPYLSLASDVKQVCDAHNAQLLLNADEKAFVHSGAHGLHFNRHRLLAATSRPVSANTWFSASCHSLGEVRHAEKIGADFVLLSPVSCTSSHPDIEPLGWEHFSNIVANANIPVYALGGMTPEDVTRAREAGGQGIAAIRSLWRNV